MNTAKSTAELTKQIEQVVHQYVAEVRRAAQEAVERAFAGTSRPSSRRPAGASAKATRSASAKRRTPQELAELGEQLYELVRTHPGESMVMFASELGQPARTLERPMSLLKREGRVRSVGQRHKTRYFPAVGDRSSKATSA